MTAPIITTIHIIGDDTAEPTPSAIGFPILFAKIPTGFPSLTTLIKLSKGLFCSFNISIPLSFNCLFNMT